MQYYCNICKKTITTDEFYYSLDKFGKPLCREHQDSFRQTSTQKIEEHAKETSVEIPQQINVETTEEISTSKKLGGFLKKVAVATGKGIVKGVKKIADASAQKIQIQRWKDQILRRMNKGELYRLCREKNIATRTTKSEVKENKKTGETYWKDYEYSYTSNELVGRIKFRVSLEDIISFAKRNHINIRDVIGDIDHKKADWKVKELTETMKESGSTILLELEKAIHEFKPLRRYYEEILYQDSLASWLKSKFHDTDVEIGRGSTRPDIVVEGIAIEVKGPTDIGGLQTISDKCMRYKQYFPHGLICVLFDVQVYPQRYEDWLRGMKNTFPDVIVIKK